jgi:hypothetical protein
MLFLFCKCKKIDVTVVSFNFFILNFCLAFKCYPLYVPIITMGSKVSSLSWIYLYSSYFDKQVYKPTKAIVIGLFYVCDSNQRAEQIYTARKLNNLTRKISWLCVIFIVFISKYSLEAFKLNKAIAVC